MWSNLPVAATKPELDRPEVLATLFQALADYPTRVRLLELLAERPMTVTELVAALGVAQGRVSSHLSCLRWGGYVRAEVEGPYNRYSLVDDRIREIVRFGESVVRDNADRLTSCLVLATEESVTRGRAPLVLRVPEPRRGAHAARAADRRGRTGDTDPRGRCHRSGGCGVPPIPGLADDPD